MSEENDFNPDWYSPTGHTIQSVMKEKGYDVSIMSELLGVNEEFVNDLLVGKLGICEKLAERLVEIFGGTKTFWLNRDKQYWSEKYRIEQERYKNE